MFVTIAFDFCFCAISALPKSSVLECVLSDRFQSAVPSPMSPQPPPAPAAAEPTELPDESAASPVKKGRKQKANYLDDGLTPAEARALDAKHSAGYWRRVRCRHNAALVANFIYGELVEQVTLLTSAHSLTHIT